MALLKFILIFFLVLWLISRVGGFLIRIFLGNLVKQNKSQTFTYTYRDNGSGKKPKDGNVKIDFDPNKTDNPKDTDYQGGEYVDYEEVK